MSVVIAAGMESDESDCDSLSMGYNYSTSADRKSKRSKNPELDFIPVSAEEVAANGTFKPPPETIADVSPSENSESHNLFWPQKSSKKRSVVQRTQPLDDLRYAIMQGNIECVKSIVENGVDIDCVLKCGWTGLMYACTAGEAEIAEYFLEKGADANFDRKDSFTPLMAVCASKKPEDRLLKCCQLLLKHKAKVNVCERHLTTPLMFATREGYLQIVRELVQAGADLSKVDNRGRTALMWAALSGWGQVVRYLLSKGDNPNAVDAFGQTAADLALQSNHEEIASLLEKSSTTLKTSLEVAENATESDMKNQKLESKLFPSYPTSNRFQTNSGNYLKQDELEIFLNGLGHSDLIETIKGHQLTFYQFLVLSEDELEKIGIDKIGVRKQIIEAAQAIHKEKWKNCSIPNLKKLPYITCPDAVSLIANIDHHLKHISSEVVYIRLQIQREPRTLELQQDNANVDNLIEETENSLTNVKKLYDELRFLKRHLNMIQGNTEYVTADLIDEEDDKVILKRQSRKTTFVFGVFVISVTIGGILWKKPESLRHISSLIASKVPYLK